MGATLNNFTPLHQTRVETLSHSFIALGYSPVCPQVNTADAQVVAGPDKPWLQL